MFFNTIEQKKINFVSPNNHAICFLRCIFTAHKICVDFLKISGDFLKFVPKPVNVS